MLTIKTFATNPIEENTYVVSDNTGECVVIDCGCFTQSEWDEVKSYITINNLKPVHQIYTHLHFDHCLGVKFVTNDFGLNPEANDADLYLYDGNNMAKQMSMFGFANSSIKMPPLSVAFREGDEVTFGNTALKVIETPGHTPGCICFYCESEGVLFSGDTLFCSSIGRTDLPGGSYEQEIKSIITKLLTLPGETKVYCGHGPSTTIADESRWFV